VAGRFLFRRFLKILRQERLTTDSPRLSSKDTIVLHTSPARPSPPESFINRAKGLVMRGFKPKDAAEIAAREIMFENDHDPDIARKVEIEAQDFLRRVREGLG